MPSCSTGSTGQGGLQAARHLVQAAEQAAAVGCRELSWASLQAWPGWALRAQSDEPWLIAAGALWHARELRLSIDGQRLQALRERLGSSAFEAVLQSPEPDLPQPCALSALRPNAAKPAKAATAADGMNGANVENVESTVDAAHRAESNWADLLQGQGRAVALASITPPGLTAALAAVLGWAESPAPVPAAQAQAWVRQAQALCGVHRA